MTKQEHASMTEIKFRREIKIPERRLARTGMKRPLSKVILAILATIQPICSQFVFPPSTESCPEEPSLDGYTSIAALNQDMDTELQRIIAGGELPPEQAYILPLCPQTTFGFDVATVLLPILNRVTFQCGSSGNNDERCVFTGGDEQVRIENTVVTGYPFNSIFFMGVTFEGFQQRSIAAMGSAPTQVTFMNCLWQDFNSQQVFRIQGNNPMSIIVRQSTIRSSSGVPDQATADDVFLNIGGGVMVDLLVVANVNVNTVFKTENNGITMVSSSSFRASEIDSISMTVAGMTKIESVSVQNNVLLTEVFVSENLGSQTSISDTIVENNVQSIPFVIVKALNGGSSIVSSSTFSRNLPVQAIIADVDTLGNGAETVVTITDSDFIMNQGAGDSFILSRNTGALVDMSRNRIEGNIGSLVNIGAYFGGDVSFTQTCFIGNVNNTALVLILEFSNYVAFNNYVENEESIVCDGGAESGPFRVSVEQPGSACFTGATDCRVDCLPGANDVKTCLADEKFLSLAPTSPPSDSQSPSVSSVPSASSRPTVTPGPSMTPEPSASRRPTDSRQPTTSPQPSISARPSASPAPTSTPRPTKSPQPTTTESPSVSPAPSTSPRPTISRQPTTSPQPTTTVSPSVSPAPSARPQPSIRPTTLPTANQSNDPEPTVQPTRSATFTPTSRPTSIPTSTPVVVPTSAPVILPASDSTTHPTQAPSSAPKSSKSVKDSQKGSKKDSVKDSKKGSKKASVKAGKKTSLTFGSTGSSNNGKANSLFNNSLIFRDGIAFAVRSPLDTRTVATKWSGQRFGGNEYGTGQDL